MFIFYIMSTYNTSKTKRLYDRKKDKGSVVVHHKKYNNYNISNMDTYELVNICPSDSRYVVNTSWETEWNIAKNILGRCLPACAPGGDISVIRFPKGSKVKFSYSSKEKTPSFAAGVNFKNIFSANCESDGAYDNSSDLDMKELDNDILVVKIKGNKSVFKNQLNCDIEYLEINRRLEQKLFDHELERDMEEFNPISQLKKMMY